MVSSKDSLPRGFLLDPKAYRHPRSLWRMHYIIQIPMYFIKWPIALFVGLLSVLFWKVPVSDDEIIAFVEGTTIITVLQREHASESAPSSGGGPPSLDVRRFSIDVKDGRLQHVHNSESDALWSFNPKKGGKVTTISSWSMKYSKSRSKGKPTATWTAKIHSFTINGLAVTDQERRYSFLHHYLVGCIHTKSHVFGDTLVNRILSDETLRVKLAESTWTTKALHYGLLYGNLGPIVPERIEGLRWMGLVCTLNREGVIEESENMAALGAAHGSTHKWKDLELPLADLFVGARAALRRTMEAHDIPLVLLDGIFLSSIVHAVDHVLYDRVSSGIKFKLDFMSPRPGTWYDHFEGAAWRVMWVNPTVNPIFNNKIRNISRPFYRQLYLTLKKIDTLNVVDQITASIMY